MSYQVTSCLVDTLGTDFDVSVLKWKNMLQADLEMVRY